MQPNLLQPTKDKDLLQPVRNDRSSSIISKLHDMFSGTDFVRVINPDTESYVWQWLPPEKERISFEGSSTTVPQRIMDRDDPEVYKLDAGESAIIPGGSAYVMIDGLVKRLMAKKTINRSPNMRPGEARNFNFSDDTAQRDWIEQVYLGIVLPFNSPEPSNEPEITKQVEDDLGLTNEKPKGRPRKATA